jgi:lysyl-tRNA synthetase class 2
MPAAGEDWRPTAPRRALQERARMLGQVRAFFAARGVMEVETPVLCGAGVTDPNLQNLTTTCRLPGDAHPRKLFLQTSPEYAMKRLLAAGSGPIYQICKAFRADELGRHHNPEFTIVEWYRPGFDDGAMVRECADLVATVTGAEAGEVKTMTYRRAFERFAGVDPLTASTTGIIERAADLGLAPGDPGGMSREGWLDLLLGHVVAPRLGHDGPLFLTEFPAAQAALARLIPGRPQVSARFELFIAGIEIANGFHELADPAEQRRRFEADRGARRERGLEDAPIDERLLAALAAGLPDSSGIALGLDRLLMVATGATALHEVIAFPTDVA